MLRKDYAVWQCGNYELSLARPRIMGVVNVTPDSFSDGGKYSDPDVAIAHAFELLDAGADIIDVGGESTRPGFTPVTPDEEAQRVIPVVRALADAGVVVSIDTRHPEVAKLAVRLGASIINDVTGFTNPEMVKVAADCGAGCIVMHAGEVSGTAQRRSVQLDSIPAQHRDKTQTTSTGSSSHKVGQDDTQSQNLDSVMQRSMINYTSTQSTGRRFPLPEEAPIMRQVMGFLGDRARELMRAGVSRERICIDPGPGFGKQAAEDIVIQRACAKMCTMGYPVLCAVSRKRFVGAVTGTKTAAERDAATIGVCLGAVAAGARILRVHNVQATTEALNAFWSVTHNDPRRAYIALGSNIGDSLGYLKKAIARINEIPATCVVGVSHAYKSAPAYGLKTAVYNAVVEVKTELPSLVLLENLLDIETDLGRKRSADTPHSGPRTIDLDLLWMEGEIHAGKRLQLPHPRMGERDFVMVPLEDLMHDPMRFLAHQGINVFAPEYRVGRVAEDVGSIAWEEACN